MREEDAVEQAEVSEGGQEENPSDLPIKVITATPVKSKMTPGSLIESMVARVSGNIVKVASSEVVEGADGGTEVEDKTVKPDASTPIVKPADEPTPESTSESDPDSAPDSTSASTSATEQTATPGVELAAESVVKPEVADTPSFDFGPPIELPEDEIPQPPDHTTSPPLPDPIFSTS